MSRIAEKKNSMSEELGRDGATVSLLQRKHQNFQQDLQTLQVSYLWTYDLYCPVHNSFDTGKSITRASGRGFGPGKSRLFWIL
jgi:hypothetical protein